MTDKKRGPRLKMLDEDLEKDKAWEEKMNRTDPLLSLDDIPDDDIPDLPDLPDDKFDQEIYSREHYVLDEEPVEIEKAKKQKHFWNKKHLLRIWEGKQKRERSKTDAENRIVCETFLKKCNCTLDISFSSRLTQKISS